MLHRLTTLIGKEILQFSRDRILLAFSLIGPAIQIILLGRAIGQDISNMPIAVIDYDLTTLSREIITALDNTDELQVMYYPANLEEATWLIDRGDVMGIVVIPPHFMEESHTATAIPQIQVIIDGVSSLIAARTPQIGPRAGRPFGWFGDVITVRRMPKRSRNWWMPVC